MKKRFGSSFVFVGLIGLIGCCLPGATAFGAYIPTIADFSRCPSVGLDTQCGVLFVINPFSSALNDFDVRAYSLGDQSSGLPVGVVQPFDGSDDTLYGVLNMSGVADPSLSLGVLGPGIGVGGQPLFAFDGDGLCAASNAPNPPGCPFEVPADAFCPDFGSGGGSYAGPGTYFSFVNDNPISKDPHGGCTSGTISFGTKASPALLPNNGFAYFSLEDATTLGACITCPQAAGANAAGGLLAAAAVTSNIQIYVAAGLNGVPIQPSVIQTAAAAATPEPATTFLLILGLTALFGKSASKRFKVRFGGSRSGG
jgi:hypothetical protein